MRQRKLFVTLSAFVFVAGIVTTLLLVLTETNRLRSMSANPEMLRMQLREEILEFSLGVNEWGRKHYDPQMVDLLEGQADVLLKLVSNRYIHEELLQEKNETPTLVHSIHELLERLKYNYDYALVDSIVAETKQLQQEQAKMPASAAEMESDAWRIYMHNILLLIVVCASGGLGLMLLFLHSRRRLDKSLYDLDRRGRAIEASHDGVVLSDKDGMITYANRAMGSIFNYPDHNTLVGQSWKILHDPLETDRLQNEAMTYLMEHGAWQGLTVGRRSDGTTFEQELSLTKFDGGIVGIVRDVTEKMTIQRSIETLSSAINAADEAIAILDRDNHTLYANRAVFKLLGPAGLETLDEAVRAEWATHIDALRAGHGQTFIEGDFKGVEGGILSLSLSLSMLSGGSVLMIVRDISARKQSEAEMESLRHQFYQAQKMEALGRMAGGMAHDFNNILAAIIGNAEFLREDLQKTSPQYNFADRIFEAGQEARGVIDQILTYARRHEVQSDSFDVKQALGETRSIVEGLMPTGAQVTWETDDLRLSIEGNASQIKQCVINLCANARDAMPKTNGALRISVEAFDGTHKHDYVARRRCEERRLLTVLEEPSGDGRIVSSVGCLQPGKSYVALGVHDNGSGIDPEVMERIFEPFFTTKPIHEGTGLGLSAVQGIVLNHNGVIIVDTAPGLGTSMYMILPAATPVLRVVGTKKKAEKQGGDRLVVVVDDQQKVLDVAAQMVQRLGYGAKGFTTAREALSFIRAEKSSVSCVLSDQTMPDMSGSDLAAELHKTDASLPVVLMSGYSAGKLETLCDELPNIKGVLRKPLVRDDLAALLKKCLEQGQDKAGQTG